MPQKDGPPLRGLRVIDFSSILSGPYCARWLADMGADVVKVEAPDGDYLRTRAPLREGRSAYFAHLNAGKRSVVLDLKRPEAVEIARRLTATADIVIESFRPGVMARLGLGYDTLAAANPGLIYCAISGYGQTGPDAGRPAFAQAVHAASGYETVNLGYQDDAERPPNMGVFIADAMTAAFAVMGVQAALIQRQATGRGQMVDATLMESMANLLVYEFQEAQFPAKERRPVYKPSKAVDGFIIIAAVNDRNFANLFKAIGCEDWATDPRYATNAARQENWDALFQEVEGWTLQRTAEDCEATLTAAGVPCSAYRTVADLIANPHFIARGSFQQVADSVGALLVPNLPFRLSGGDVSVRSPVPDLGADTDAVLAERLEMDQAELDRLRADGVFG